MRKWLVIIQFFCTVPLLAQTFSVDFESVEETVQAGYEGAFYGDLSVDSFMIYNFELSITNADLPPGWFYVICTPYSCLSPMISTVNFDLDTADMGSSEVQVKIQTNLNTIPGVGTLDVTLRDTLTNDSITHSLTLHVGAVGVDEFLSKRKLVKAIDLLGRSVDVERQHPLTPLILLYDDGTMERRVYLP